MTTHLDRALIRRAFAMMSDILSARGQRGEIVIAGGAAMALQYDVNRVTRDVDGLVVEGHGGVIDAAHQVAGQLALPRGWLNEGVSVYDKNRVPVFDHPALIVYSASPDHMLALKARAARASDLDDLRTLISSLAIHSAAEIVAVVRTFFPDDPLSARSVAVLEDLFR